MERNSAYLLDILEAARLAQRQHLDSSGREFRATLGMTGVRAPVRARG
jgi:hypothetical protein